MIVETIEMPIGIEKDEDIIALYKYISKIEQSRKELDESYKELFEIFGLAQTVQLIFE